MSSKKIKIAIIINMMPSYRAGFYNDIFANEDTEATVYCHVPPPNSTIRPIHENYGNNVKICKAIYLNNEAIVISILPWKEIILNYDAVFIEGNPRYITHALLATALKFIGKNIILWTMAHSYRNQKISQWIRISWTKMFNNILVYSDKEVSHLKKIGFNRQKIIGINNGLDQSKINNVMSLWSEDALKKWRIETELENKIIILSCARLEPKNKFQYFAEAMPNILKEFPNVLWCIIGEGKEESTLLNVIKKNKLEENVRLLGSIHTESLLAPWFLNSYVMVHPAAIGLSILHSYGYGLPVITHSNANHHGPEFAAFEEGITGMSFAEDSISDLINVTLQLLRKTDVHEKMKKSCKEVVQLKYNTNIMSKRFIKFAKETAHQKLNT
jgi:glycosyltransferase involved in cell wall biosynthesis